MTTASMPDGDAQRKVAAYFDHEACNYEERYWSNPVVQRLRQSFREEVKSHSFTRVLEIGCGVGMDVAHFGSIYPDRQFDAIDIAPAMVNHAKAKVGQLGLTNVRVTLGAVEDLAQLYPDVKFDHVYVFFGALNTVPDLPRVARILRDRMNPDGTMVLTFVNKWYVSDMLLNLARLRFGRAFQRLRRVWGGYSEQHRIDSRCFSPREIRRAFGREFQITHRQGYSILYPAWYQLNWQQRFGRRVCELLWSADQFLNRTPAWSLGEYALYSFQAKN